MSTKKQQQTSNAAEPSSSEILQGLGDPGLDPFEIEFLPEFEQNRGPREAFVNEYGVVIGDHMYESTNSPLQQWTLETDPMIMAGDEWVHPYKDIGFQSGENRDFFEKGISSAAEPGALFMHADKDVAYAADPGQPKTGKPEEAE